ncbi:MAG: PAS domain S-box protein, partial [Planctomycetaceae bacterium]
KIFEVGQIGIALVGSDFRTIKTNPALSRILGYTADELRVLKFPDVTHPDDVDTDVGLAEALFDGDIPFYQIEKRFIRKDGEQVWASLTVSLIRDGDDQPLYALGMVEDITERKLAQDALERSEAYLAESQRLSRTGSFAWDVARQESTYWSPELYRMLGVDPDAGMLPYQEWLDLIHPDDRARYAAVAEQGLREKTDVGLDFRIVLDDGSTKHLHTVAHPILDDSGAVIEMFGTCVDVTEQHQARVALEQALAEIKGSEDRLRLVIDTIPVFVESSLPDGTVDFVNQHWREFFGPGLGDVREVDWTAVIHPDDLQRTKDEWTAAVSTGTNFELELRLRRTDGDYRWILCRIAPLRSEAGEIVKWYGTGVDIEDRKRAEQELRASERRYRHMVEDQLDFVVRWLPGGVRTFANRAYCEYFGQSLERVAGTSFFPLILEEDREQVRRRIEALTPANPVSFGEHRIVRQDGTVAWNEWTDRAMFDEQGKLVELQSVGRDITERKKAEKRAQDAALTTARFSLLSGREREVLDLVVAGKANKVIAQRLEITERTVEKHRASVMRKLQAQSAAELVRLALIAQQSKRDR